VVADDVEGREAIFHLVSRRELEESSGRLSLGRWLVTFAQPLGGLTAWQLALVGVIARKARTALGELENSIPAGRVSQSRADFSAQWSRG
jgi:hypothetical protein